MGQVKVVVDITEQFGIAIKKNIEVECVKSFL